MASPAGRQERSRRRDRYSIWARRLHAHGAVEAAEGSRRGLAYPTVLRRPSSFPATTLHDAHAPAAHRVGRLLSKLGERAASDLGTRCPRRGRLQPAALGPGVAVGRSEEHTSELQSRGHLVCRLLLEKKKEIA